MEGKHLFRRVPGVTCKLARESEKPAVLGGTDIIL